MLLGERALAAFRGARYDDRDALCSIGLNLMNSVLGIVLGGLLPLALYVVVYEQGRLFTIDSLWLALPLAFLIHELAYYAEHRMSHRIGLLWAFHAIHHSSNEFNHTTAAAPSYRCVAMERASKFSAARARTCQSGASVPHTRAKGDLSPRRTTPLWRSSVLPHETTSLNECYVITFL